MAITLSERVLSRSFVNSVTPEIRFKYWATGTDDDVALLAYLNANIPGQYENLFLRSVSADPTEEVDEDSGTGRWEIEAIYTSPEVIPFEIDDPTTSFDTAAGTSHIVQSLYTVHAYAASGTPADFKGAIGVNNKKVAGTDIKVPTYEFQESYPFFDSSVTNGYKGLLASLTGTVNNGSFKGFAAGECLFLGASGQRRGANGIWTISFKFSAAPNYSIANGNPLTIGTITNIEKDGQDIIWVQYEDSTDQDVLVQIPRAVYVERVYQRKDFAALGIGT